MKKLDRYIAKNFLVGYAIAFFVLIGMRIIIDLFVNLDEFTEKISDDYTTRDAVKYIINFYLLNSLLYFRDFAGMITVVAASFSFGKMIRSNELIAIMASGISLKRTIWPVILLALILTGALVINQELVIPSLADKLVRSHDDIPGQESYNVRFIIDGNGSLIFSQRFDVKTATLYNPTILRRIPASKPGIWEVTARIDAGKAVIDKETGNWELYTKDPNSNEWKHYGRIIERDPEKPISYEPSYLSDITAKDIPIRSQSENKTLMSLRQLTALASQRTKIRDMAQLYSQKHFRITEPLISLVMLLISLPILVCRDPKTMKSAVMVSFAITSLCFVLTFICKMLATEQVVFNKVIPEFWAWLPVFIFLPVSFIALDSMKT
ncbi:MAG: LptF/LptG family permease [Sedimentisphaerales bacterium]|nr:LptF/LptG family permease [Sedimentisphaerales bacterium]